MLFVYGTLLTGTGNPALDRLVGRSLVPQNAAVVAGRLYYLDGYPGAVPDPDCKQVIRGVIAKLRHPGLCWPRLDRYEDCGRLYVREQIVALTLPGRRAVECWIYRYRGATLHRRPVAGGDYLRQAKSAGTCLRIPRMPC